jgi:hypothetical protein
MATQKKKNNNIEMQTNDLMTTLSSINVTIMKLPFSYSVKALIDNGSQINLLHIKHIQDRTQLREVPIKIRSASGHELKYAGAIDQLIKIGNLTLRLAFLVVEKFPHDMLLSNQAFKHFAAQFDYSNNMCQFTDPMDDQQSGWVRMFMMTTKTCGINALRAWLCAIRETREPHGDATISRSDGSNLLHAPEVRMERRLIKDKDVFAITEDYIIPNGHLIYIRTSTKDDRSMELMDSNRT